MIRAIAFMTLLACPALAQTAQGPTLSAARSRGFVRCATTSVTPGFSSVDSAGKFRGLDVDVCRAIAAAVFEDAATPGDTQRARFTPVTSSQRLVILQSGEVDVAVEGLTQTISREASTGLLFAGTDFYDGQGFLVRKSSGVTRATELGGASVCVVGGSTSELNLTDWTRANKLQVHAVIFESEQQARTAYDSGRCDAYTIDASNLIAAAMLMHDRDNQQVLPDIISKEPVGPAVRQGDDQWFLIVKWPLNALIEAEEQGITQANVDEKLESVAPATRRLLGVQGDFGKFLGLDNCWAYRPIKAVGNYGEAFERNFGGASGLNLPRGKNDLWSRGGLLFSAPFR